MWSEVAFVGSEEVVKEEYKSFLRGFAYDVLAKGANVVARKIMERG